MSIISWLNSIETLLVIQIEFPFISDANKNLSEINGILSPVYMILNMLMSLQKSR
ncbi:MAG TPA: hypothetical protein VK115_08905 [Staphylococcus sp.]|nr:hypothetical protein [Staphylococcus sp.]